MISIKDFEQMLKDKKGNGYLRDMDYSFCDSGNTLKAKFHGTFNKWNSRQLDPLTLHCIVEAKKETGIKISRIVFTLEKNTSVKDFHLYFEAFRRRLSFLNINNKGIKFELYLAKKEIELDEGFIMKPYEFIRKAKPKTPADNISQQPEKQLQTYIDQANRPDLLGDNFVYGNNRKPGIHREYLTGIFDSRTNKNEIEKDNNRILPRDQVDFVTVNKYGCLSLIELKVLHNHPLNVVSQILDYALYFAYYKDLLLNTDTLKPLVADIKKNEISCYVNAHEYDKRFDSIFPYYQTHGNYDFEFYKVYLPDETKEIIKKLVQGSAGASAGNTP